MKEALTSANSRDYRQRYEGTYGMYSHDVKTPLLVQLKSVNEVCCVFQDKNGVEYRVNADSGIPFEFFPVDRRLVNHGDQVIYSHRKPDRQWSRGVCDANTAMQNVTVGKSVVVGVDFDTVSAVYQPDRNYSQHYKSFLEGKRKAVAISDQFMLRKDSLLIYDRPVGIYTDGKVQVHKMYLQEVKDVVKRNKLDLIVEIMNA